MEILEKICPVLSTGQETDPNYPYPGVKCIGPECAWYVKEVYSQYPKDPETGLWRADQEPIRTAECAVTLAGLQVVETVYS